MFQNSYLKNLFEFKKINRNSMEIVTNHCKNLYTIVKPNNVFW